MNTVCNSYFEKNICSVVYTARGWGSGPVAVVELPSDIHAMVGMAGDMCVVGKFGTIYELDFLVLFASHKLLLKPQVDEATECVLSL